VSSSLGTLAGSDRCGPGDSGLGWPGASGVATPLALVARLLHPARVRIAIGIARRFHGMELPFFFSWFATGRREFVVLAACLPPPFLVLLPRLETSRARWLVVTFLSIVVLWFAILPFVEPALNRSFLLSLRTDIDRSGVCRQSTSYNCGPAAAVTLLRRMGVTAQEGELAVLAHTSQSAGTPFDLLCDAVCARYGAEGVTAQFRRFSTVDELGRAGPTIAVIKYLFLVDHYVAVLEVQSQNVVIGDPLKGKRVIKRSEFEEVWRRTGIVISRTPVRR